jgi:hypothetical protein
MNFRDELIKHLRLAIVQAKKMDRTVDTDDILDALYFLLREALKLPQSASNLDPQVQSILTAATAIMGNGGRIP